MNTPEKDIPDEVIFGRFFRDLVAAAKILANPSRNVAEENQFLELMRASADEAMHLSNSRDTAALLPVFRQAIRENPDLKAQIIDIADRIYHLDVEADL